MAQHTTDARPLSWLVRGRVGKAVLSLSSRNKAINGETYPSLPNAVLEQRSIGFILNVLWLFHDLHIALRSHPSPQLVTGYGIYWLC